jgi:hypothetical protein
MCGAFVKMWYYAEKMKKAKVECKPDNLWLNNQVGCIKSLPSDLALDLSPSYLFLSTLSKLHLYYIW